MSTTVNNIVLSVLKQTRARAEHMLPLYSVFPGSDAAEDLRPEVAYAAFQAARGRVEAAQLDAHVKEHELQEIRRGIADLERLVNPPEGQAYFDDSYEGPGPYVFVVTQNVTGEDAYHVDTLVRGVFTTVSDAQVFVKKGAEWLRKRGAIDTVRNFAIERRPVDQHDDACLAAAFSDGRW